jgi:hypothetical protein
VGLVGGEGGQLSCCVCVEEAADGLIGGHISSALPAIGEAADVLP